MGRYELNSIPGGNGYLTEEFAQNAPIDEGVYKLLYYLVDGMHAAVLKGVYEEEVELHTWLNDSIETGIPAAKQKIVILIERQSKAISHLLRSYVYLKAHIATAQNKIEEASLETLRFFQLTVDLRQEYAVEINAIDWLFEHVKESVETTQISGRLT
jgi:hypothetical protein